MRKSVIIKLIVFVTLALVVESAFFYGYLRFDLNRFSRERSEKTKEFIYDQEQYSLKDVVMMAHGIISRYHEQAMDIEGLKKGKSRELKQIIDGLHSQITAYYKANRGLLSREELEGNIKELVKGFRYDGDNYIWINDTRPYMVMHPTKPELDGKDLSDNADPHGKRLFVEMVAVCKKDGEGMVDYMWSKPGEEEAKPKVSYVKLIPELGWIIGTGAWIEDIEEALKVQAMGEIGKIRMGDGNYFWIQDLEPRMLMHPTSPELNGQSLADMKDEKGKTMFVEMAQQAGEKGEGYVDYYWTKPGEEGIKPKLSYVKLFEPWGWVVGMGVYMDDVDAMVASEQEEFTSSMSSLMNRALLIVGGIVILIVVLMVWYIKSDLRTPLGLLVKFADKVSGGDLAASISGRFKGEILKLKSSIETMVDSLKVKMAEAEAASENAQEEAKRAKVAQSEAEAARAKAELAKKEGMLEAAHALEGIVESLSTASEELSAQADEINNGTNEQKDRLGETATAMEEMNATILEVARNSSQAAENADRAKGKAQDGSGIVGNSVEAINKVQQLAMTLKENMDQLGDQAEAIGQVMNVINDIADQTNLLALNAAIEAARAGEAGRGFAVVADEVRKLAEKTMQATKEVGGSISAIQDSATMSNESVLQAVEAVEKATELAGSSGEALGEIVSLSEDTADQVRSIATAAEEQSSASEELTRTIEQINDLSNRIAEGMSQSTLAQQELAQQALNLKNLIDKMKEENS